MLQGLCQLLQLILINLARDRASERGRTTRYLFLVRMSVHVNWIVIDSLLVSLSLSLPRSQSVAVKAEKETVTVKYTCSGLHPASEMRWEKKLISIFVPRVPTVNRRLRWIAIFNFATWIFVYVFGWREREWGKTRRRRWRKNNFNLMLT